MSTITKAQYAALRKLVGEAATLFPRDIRTEDLDATFDENLRNAGIEVEKTPEERIEALKEAVKAYDARLDDPNGDGSGDDARPPEGDDYNELYSLIQHHLGGWDR